MDSTGPEQWICFLGDNGSTDCCIVCERANTVNSRFLPYYRYPGAKKESFRYPAEACFILSRLAEVNIERQNESKRRVSIVFRHLWPKRISVGLIYTFHMFMYHLQARVFFLLVLESWFLLANILGYEYSISRVPASIILENSFLCTLSTTPCAKIYAVKILQNKAWDEQGSGNHGSGRRQSPDIKSWLSSGSSKLYAENSEWWVIFANMANRSDDTILPFYVKRAKQWSRALTQLRVDFHPVTESAL
jgi:hypothetical protein